MSGAEIVAIGGCNFTDPAQPPRLERYLLALTRPYRSGQRGGPPEATQQHSDARPRVCFIGSASGDSDSYLSHFYASFAALDCRPSHLSLFRRTRDLRAQLLGADLIYVGGGNTQSLLALWHGWGLPALLREAAAGGTILAGTSAGAICWFDAGVTDSWADELRAVQALGMLGGSCCPHYDAEIERRPTYHRLLNAGLLQTGYAISNRAALHFNDGTLLRAIAADSDARAYRVASEGGICIEEPLAMQRLDDAGVARSWNTSGPREFIA